jgi:AcrR family transcriptional regulator
VTSTPITTEAAGRRYGGRTTEERRALRREQLVEAGKEVFGTAGMAGASIRAVLRESGLAERYFAESFSSLEALCIAVHESFHAEVVAAVTAATEGAGDDVEARARAGLRAFIDKVTEDPRRARMMIELGTSSSEELRAFHRRAQNRYAALMVAYGPLAAAQSRGLDGPALAHAVLMAVASLLNDWVTGELPLSMDGLIDHAVLIIMGTVNQLERA